LPYTMLAYLSRFLINPSNPNPLDLADADIIIAPHQDKCDQEIAIAEEA
jgi:hypothetical protein